MVGTEKRLVNIWHSEGKAAATKMFHNDMRKTKAKRKAAKQARKRNRGK